MERYEKFFIYTLSGLKRSTIYFWLKSNNFSEHFIKNLRKNPHSFRLNETFCSINTKLNLGDTLEILKSPQNGSNIPFSDEKLDILFEDEEYLIVNKPHQLACIPTRSHFTDNLGSRVAFYMKEKEPNFVLRIVNRLDKDTAGIVIIAKNPLAYNNIKGLEKTYYALCEGRFENKAFTIDKPIFTINENGINQMKRIISDKGKPAVTHGYIEEQFENFALVKLKLETGRTHQIRVHLSSEGHALFGDPIYSQHSKLTEHTFLILKEISFQHYKTKQNLTLCVPFPAEWKEFLGNEKNKKTI